MAVPMFLEIHDRKTMTGIYDIFFSYRRHDLPRAKPLLDALESAGLHVWRDESAIDEGVSITKEIRQGIASSKVVVAFYSGTYPLSVACQEEIISAWLAAEKAREPPQHRVRIVNPEQAFDHIPASLRDIKAHTLPENASGLAAFAREVRDHISSLDGLLAAAALQQPPQYHGVNPIHAPRFVGRVQEFWDLHGKLTGNRMSMISGVYGQSTAQVRGLGGNGKTLLAREYAIRFGPAYPGGVFWLNAYGNEDSSGSLDQGSRLASRQDQIRRFAADLGVAVEGRKPEEIESDFWRQISDRGAACLWIADDLPSGLAASEIERYWCARWANASTLITTRSREYGSLGEHLDLDVLPPREAVELLAKRRGVNDGSEKTAAQRITEILSYHPMALEVAGSYLAKGTQTFQQYLDELIQPGQAALEYGSLLRESLPTGHDRSISRTLLKSIKLLGEEGVDFLCLASVLATAPISISAVREVFEAFGFEAGISETVLRALDQTDSLSLCENAGQDGRRVHTLISRVVRSNSVMMIVSSV
jgi:TIR domain